MNDDQNIFEEENTNTESNGAEPQAQSAESSGNCNQNTDSTYGQYNSQGNQQYGQYSAQGNQQYGQYNSQGNQQYYNPYQQSVNARKQGQGFGIASMVLGIISLVLFCTCINFLLGLLALIFGIIQIVRYEKKGLAIAGIVTSAVSFVLFFICWAMLMTSDEFMDTLQRELYEYDEVYEYNYDQDMTRHQFENHENYPDVICHDQVR